MFSLDETIPENFNDEIGSLLKQITQIKTNTKIRQEFISDVVNIGKKQKYIFFVGYTHRYFIGRIGQSFIYKVPENKKGTIEKFKGKIIRVICIGSGERWVRRYMAGVI
tara:strand:+ start:1487 stop:1813 length:327 start_codon:yes stop_codon:yes gene_type:complete